MAKISPFKGWRYNEDNIDLFEDVIVPPYDVITREEQEEYYCISALSPIGKLLLGEKVGETLRFNNMTSTITGIF